jgi:hypothetical protein
LMNYGWGTWAMQKALEWSSGKEELKKTHRYSVIPRSNSGFKSSCSKLDQNYKTMFGCEVVGALHTYQ